MYNLIPIVSIEIIYKAKLKVKKVDSIKIVDNLEVLIGESNIKVTYKEEKEENENIKFYISSNEQRELEVFYFKISSIANDSFIRRKKIEK